jgi:hypothetical protein
MATNDFQPFAVSGGANVISQAAYLTLLSGALVNGFLSGTAASNQLNKVWRQSSIMSAVLSQFIVDETGANAVDDGTTVTLLANLKAAIAILAGPAGERICHATGTANALVAAFTRPPTAYLDGVPFFVRATVANTGTTPTVTFNSGTLAAKTIVKDNNVALVPGDIGGAGHWLQLQYDSGLDKIVLANPVFSFTAARAPVSLGNVAGVPYTNTASYEITALITVRYQGNNTGGTAIFFINGVQVGSSGHSNNNATYTCDITTTLPIPPGDSYQVNLAGAAAILSWVTYI